ncbi:putative enoyl-CoA hydratase isomerase family protein [Lyophyllum shimeji]|uniref:3-hydroxyisobutyryl-CoA hydrolase n=1 Tax=Lyophyllum shimeji TaxID=47721 RepID=A0A9P3UIX1_LYOSH|nr:putative enoyl-CoA hydratase isomerase family protein [Lyophyllum shimeji]
MMSVSSSAPTSEPPVLFESNLAMRTYILNRPLKLNALDEAMLDLLRPKIEEWSASDLCGIIVGTGVGRAFCAGGDVASVVEYASKPETRPRAVYFFKREFEMDYILAMLRKPYVAILDGHTMGGGVGLSAHAPFRIATENTLFSMPETKIGYCPDVGGSYFMSRLDGELGTYLALTGNTINGRHVFELGCATHYVPSRRIPILLDRLSALENAHPSVINNTVEEFTAERQPEEPPLPLVGETRDALDYAFRHDEVEKIIQDLEAYAQHTSPAISRWARQTLEALHLRSPTSLKVALKAIRQGKKMTLLQALDMELRIATAYCNGASPDFATGVKAVLVDKVKGKRPEWSPPTLNEVSDEIVSRFFSPDSPYLSSVPNLEIPEHLKSQEGTHKPMKYALPTEDEIGAMVRGSHSAGGGTGLTLDELLANFDNIRNGKLGVREKVLEVARRKCDVKDNGGDGNFIWLKWKHQLNRP